MANRSTHTNYEMRQMNDIQNDACSTMIIGWFQCNFVCVWIEDRQNRQKKTHPINHETRRHHPSDGFLDVFMTFENGIAQTIFYHHLDINQF